MPQERPMPPLILAPEERVTLERWSRRPKTAQTLAQRSRMVLACAAGTPNGTVAALGQCPRRHRSREFQKFLDAIDRAGTHSLQPASHPRQLRDTQNASHPSLAGPPHSKWDDSGCATRTLRLFRQRATTPFHRRFVRERPITEFADLQGYREWRLEGEVELGLRRNLDLLALGGGLHGSAGARTHGGADGGTLALAGDSADQAS
jgi:hypothetical protein